jgi:salicylate hydroxylase
MLPYLAQGAAQAIEDGFALADMLDRGRADPAQALQAYEQARRPRTSRIQLHARERGKINNTTSAFARFKRDLGYRLKRLIKPKQHTYKIEWIYGHDVTAQGPTGQPRSARAA